MKTILFLDAPVVQLVFITRTNYAIETLAFDSEFLNEYQSQAGTDGSMVLFLRGIYQ